MARFVQTILTILPLLALLLGACAGERAADPGAEDDRAALPVAEEEPEAEPLPSVRTATEAIADGDRVAASHILIAHAAARRRPMHISRDAKAARDKAERILARIRKGEDFEALARAESDCSSASKGGFLGAFGHGAMDARFEAAAYALDIGGIAGPVETPFGFHIIRRDEIEEIHVSQILQRWNQRTPDPDGALRAAAQARALQARERLDAGEPFDGVARALSNGPAAPWGGDLGWMVRGDSLPDWEERAFALEPGDIDGPFETEAGFHIIRREP